MSYPEEAPKPRKWRFDADPTLSFQSQEIAEFARVWAALSKNGTLPHRKQLEPLDIKPILPHTFIIGVSYEPRPRFTYRLIGTHIVETLGRDSTGKSLEDIHATTPEVIESLVDTVDRRRPLRTFGSVSWIDKEYLDFETGVFPFLTDDDRIGQLAGATVYRPIHHDD